VNLTLEIYFRTTAGSLNLLYDDYAAKLTRIMKLYPERNGNRKNYFSKKRQAFKCKASMKTVDTRVLQICQMRNYLFNGGFKDFNPSDPEVWNDLRNFVQLTIDNNQNNA
jgi:hypothetical protein